MSQKINVRKQLESDLAIFLSNGRQITKCPIYGKKREPKPKEETVEVEIDTAYLPSSLRKKYFGE